MDIEEQLLKILTKRRRVRHFNVVWIAYSGGMDSTALLHAAARVVPQLDIQLRAVHVDHGLHPLSPSWAAQCAEICEALSIPLQCVRANLIPEKGESLEQQAREARYRIFNKVMADGDGLLTAHHERDQAETVFVQLFRGAGPKGLSAMPESSPLGDGELIRPFLDVPYEALSQYATKHQLRWIDDPSNQCTDITRNFVRHDVLPMIQERWPTITRSISRSSRHCAEAAEILDTMAQQDLGVNAASELSHQIELDTLGSLSVSRRKNALRYWIRSMGLRLPSSAKLEDIDRQLFSAAEGCQPCVKWGDGLLRRYRNSAYLLTNQVFEKPASPIAWDVQANAVLDLPMGQLSVRTVVGDGVSSDWISAEFRRVSVQFRRGGERVQYKRGLHKKLNQVFQELGVPPWQRDFTPLIFAKGELVAVAGHGVFKPYRAQADAVGCVIEFRVSS